MKNNHENDTGGASITPKARPSIHNHRRSCAFLDGERSMVRYGLNRKNSQTNSPNNEQGVDEPDNIVSKCARRSSPIAAERIVQKRHSCDESSPSSDQSTSKVLAQSLPAKFPSRSNSSDEFGDWSRQRSPNTSNESSNIRENVHEGGINTANCESFTSQRLQNDSKRVRGFCPENERYNGTDASNYENYNQGNLYENYNHSRRSETKPHTMALIGILSLMAFLLALYFVNASDQIPEIFTTGMTTDSKYNMAKFYSDLNDFGAKYKITDNSIMKLQTGISTIFERQDTGSFIFAYKSDNKNFDPDIFNNLMNTIASITSKYLRNTSTSIRHVVVDGSNLRVDSHSELINKYREDVTKTGVMLVREVDEVPSALAMAFHYYCDEFNPIAKRSAIFFTLDMTKCSHNPVEQKPTYAHIEKCLHEKWSGLPKDNINPLLNRVVSIVVDIAGD